MFEQMQQHQFKIDDTKNLLPFQFFNGDVQAEKYFDSTSIEIAKGTLSECLASQYGDWVNEFISKLSLANFRLKPSALMENYQVKVPVAGKKVPVVENRTGKPETASPKTKTMFTHYISVFVGLDLVGELFSPVLFSDGDGYGLNLLDTGTGEIKEELVSRIIEAAKTSFLDRGTKQVRQAINSGLSQLTHSCASADEQLQALIQAAKDAGAMELVALLQGKNQVPSDKNGAKEPKTKVPATAG